MPDPAPTIPVRPPTVSLHDLDPAQVEVHTDLEDRFAWAKLSPLIAVHPSIVAGDHRRAVIEQLEQIRDLGRALATGAQDEIDRLIRARANAAIETASRAQRGAA